MPKPIVVVTSLFQSPLCQSPFNAQKSSYKTSTLSTVMTTTLLSATVLLSGCNKEATPEANDKRPPASENQNIAAEGTDTINNPNNTDSSENMQSIDNNEEQTVEQQSSTRDHPLSIDWGMVDSGEKAIDPASFKYPFGLDSEPVRAQAEYSDISAKQAQHSLTVGMASNEPLERIIDQLGDSYLSHTYSESDAKLTVYTTPNVTPSTHNYVISHEFAKGLTLPIEVTHGSEQASSSAHN